MMLHLPSTSDLLQVWERCLTQQPIEQAITILHATNKSMSRAEITELTIGERDAGLLIIRQKMFGEQVNSTSRCPACCELMEWNTCITDLNLHSRNKQKLDSEILLHSQQHFSISSKSYNVRFRLPNSSDLIAISALSNKNNARDLAQQQLLSRCVNKVEKHGKLTLLKNLPETVVTDIANQMQQADPQADMSVELNCANCSHSWDAVFDIVTFLWSEFNAWATQVLRLVHNLASAYGWSEQTILAMTPLRRQFYMEMVYT